MSRRWIVGIGVAGLICIGLGAPAHAAAPSGSITYAGHTISWSVSGVSAPTGDLVGRYDGVVTAGSTVTFSGSAVFAMGGGVTNLYQSASFTGTAGKSFSQRVGGGTYTLPFTLTATAPTPAAGQISSMTAGLSSRNCNDSGVCGGPSISVNLAVVGAAPPPAPQPQPGQRQMIAAAYKCLKGYLIEAKGHKFYKWTSRGSQDLYRSTLAGAVLEVNPSALRGTANAQYLDGVITVRKDPRSLNADECAAFGKTMWEEVSHAIEDTHGDTGFGQSEDRKEARVDYMLEMDEAWAILSGLEEQAAGGASAAKLRKIWRLYNVKVRKATQKAIGRGYVPNRTELNDWFGWYMVPRDIRKNYLDGKFLPGPKGEALRKALR